MSAYYRFICLAAVVALFWPISIKAQMSAAQSRMEKGKWESARQLLYKSLRKDSLSIESEFGLAHWYFASLNPDRQIDSAYFYINTSLKDYTLIAPKQREKLRRDEVDSTTMLHLRAQIDSAAFEEAHRLHTEKSYSDFLAKFKYASERDKAIEYRDELSYQDAVRANTYAAFYDYVHRYPDSKRKEEAQRGYDKLLKEYKTKDQKLKSYIAFRKEYPSSPYRKEVEKQIFEISTAGGDPATFIQFIKDYPASDYSRIARDILFYLLKEREDKIPPFLLTDSLKKIQELNARYWVPVLRDGKYGFIDSHGKEMLPPQFETIKGEYKCGTVKDDILLTSRGLITRDGNKIAEVSKDVADIGYGFLKVGDSTCYRLLHKSGQWAVKDCSQNYVIVGGRYIAALQHELYALYAFNGRKLSEAQWRDIEVVEGVVVLTRMGKKFAYTYEQITQLADGGNLQQDLVFDEIKPFGAGVLWVHNGALEGMMNNRLEFTVPLERQVLTQTPYGLIRKKEDHFTLSGQTQQLEQMTWDKMRYYKRWLFLQRKEDQQLFDLISKKIITEKADSIWFDNGLAFVVASDSLNVFSGSAEPVRLSKKARVTFIKSRDSVQYFYADVKQKRVVYDIVSGKKLFVSDFDQIESLNASTFLISRKNKKGLLAKDGKPMIPVEYDAIVVNQGHYLSLLKEKKFGLYDLKRRRLAKPTYDRNLLPLDENILIAFKDGYYGLIDWDAKPITKFEFEEVQPWNAETILVKKAFQWMVYDFKTGNVVLEKIRDFQWIHNTGEERTMLAHRDNYFGVVDNKKGVIIPLTFSEIINLGTGEEPLYFTDKEVEEAEIHVVIYYNRNGELLRKQVYEEEEYERIYCDDK